MFGDNFVLTPMQHKWTRLIANHERQISLDRVLFHAVDLHRRMISSGTKVVTPLQVTGVNVRAGIDDEGAPTCGHFDAQLVVMSMRTTAVDARAARVETQVKIFVTHDVSAGVRERFRSSFRLAQLCIVERLGPNLQQVAMVIRGLLLERKKLSTVSVANQRREAVRSNIGTDVKKHRPKF